jgi:cytochrome b subunit of formate dehydrogenase
MKTSPYQPILLRLLHSAISLLVFASLITGFMLYNQFDRRFGSISLPIIPNTMGIHGTIALTFLILLPIFAIYSFHIGDRRLIQKQTLQQLQEFGKPIWWVSLQRLVNTLMLLATAIAVITGRMMQEVWMPKGELNRAWYIGHLIAWLLMIVSIAIHLLMSAKVGGLPLLLSMYNWQIKSGDLPKDWLKNFQVMPKSIVLFVFEFLVMGGIAIAFLLPLVSST